jgi:hypothetical protein
MIFLVFLFIRAMYPAILFRIFLEGKELPIAFLLDSKSFAKLSGVFFINCLDVLFTNVGFILPILMNDILGLKALWFCKEAWGSLNNLS